MKTGDRPESRDQDLDEMYEKIAREFDGKDRHEGLYLICLDEANGDVLEARLLYARKRLLQLTRV